MATSAEVKALLAVACPYCGAPAGSRCGRTVGKTVIRPHTLDGESHDARWNAARLGSAVVLVERLAERKPAPDALAASARPW